MLASAIEPRFKHLSFLSASFREETYRALKEQIVAWKIDRLPQPSAAATVLSSPTALTSGSDAPSTSTPSVNRGNVFSMFDCLTQGARNVNTICDYDRVTSEVNAQFGHFLNEPLAESDTNPLQWWRKEMPKFPTLEIAVRSLFCIPSTSEPVERVFSSARKHCK